jgi:putative acetyltransferase
MMIQIRPEQIEEIAAIRRVNERAFNGPAEADLVDRLRERGQVTLSLVAVRAGEIVGHILFSPVVIESPRQTIAAVGLAPMAVLPELQNQGIGSLLVSAGLERCRSAGHLVAVVLGHPQYYRRFGFVPASRYTIRSEYDVADEHFMVIELRPGALAGQSGTVKYQAAFNEL